MFDLVIVERGSFCSAVATPRPHHHTASPDGDDDTTGRANDEFAVSEVGNKRTPYPKGDTSVHATGRRRRIRHLDIVQTFSPRPHVLCITAKIFLAAWILAILALSVEEEMFKSFYMAYLTHWGYSITSMYAIASLICAVYLAVRHRSSLSANNITTPLTCCCGAGSGGGVAGFLIKTTWALFSIALPVEIAIAILFWTTVYEFKSSEAVTYVTGMVHGGTAVLLLLDGFVMSRIPLHWRQFVLFETFCILYIVWNVAHAFSGIGNPYDGVTQDDDAIYPMLDWKPTQGTYAKSILLAVGFLVVGNPIVFGICWRLSRLLPLRLMKEDIDVEEEEEEVEESYDYDDR